MTKLFENNKEGREKAYQLARANGNELWEEHIDWINDGKPRPDIPSEFGRGLLAIVTQVVTEDPSLMTGEEARVLDDVRVNHGMVRAFTLASVVPFSQAETTDGRAKLRLDDMA